MSALAAFVERELATPVAARIAGMAEQLAAQLNGRAVLFYGSALRTGDMDGVLDFYVLTENAGGSLLRRAGMRWLWPDVSFHEITVDGLTLRAKVATMPLTTIQIVIRAVVGPCFFGSWWSPGSIMLIVAPDCRWSCCRVAAT